MTDKHADAKKKLCRLVAEDGEARWSVEGRTRWFIAPDEWPSFDMPGTYQVRPVPKARYQNVRLEVDGTLVIGPQVYNTRIAADDGAGVARTHILITKGDEITVEKV